MSASVELVRFKGFRDGVIQVEQADGLDLGELRLNGQPRIGDAVLLVRKGDVAVVCGTVALTEQP